MNLLVLGLNHETAPIQLRERVAFSASELEGAIESMRSTLSLSEVVILSTCNRTELVCVASETIRPALIEWLASYHHCEAEDLEPAIYSHEGSGALNHLIRVACGLDSMILGEPQIFGQVKSAFLASVEVGSAGPELQAIYQHIFNTTKRVRSETEIGRHSVTAPATAIGLARNIFSDLNRCNGLLIGAGEMTALAGQQLREAGVSSLTIANRTLSNATELASELKAELLSLADLNEHLDRFDLIITATGARLPIIGKGLMERVIKSRKRAPVFMLDLAVPRDIEPEVGDLRDVYLYSLDDLQSTIAANLAQRHVAAEDAEQLITIASNAYLESAKARQNQDTLIHFRQHLESLGQIELEKARSQLARGADPEAVLAQLSRALVNKIAHQPSHALREAGKRDDKDFINMAASLFGLNGSSDEIDPDR